MVRSIPIKTVGASPPYSLLRKSCIMTVADTTTDPDPDSDPDSDPDPGLGFAPEGRRVGFAHQQAGSFCFPFSQRKAKNHTHPCDLGVFAVNPYEKFLSGRQWIAPPFDAHKNGGRKPTPPPEL